jgi:hypothetical protein
MSSRCRRVSWRSCSCCFRNIFFQQIENFFVLEMINVRIIMILFQKILFWMYHLFFQRNKSFSMFHLNDESRSTFLRLLFDTKSSFFFESKRFAFSLSLSCFIDVFSTKNRTRCANESDCYKINNTMRSFKNETLNVVFLFKTFFIQSFEARSSLFATFSSRSLYEIFSMFRNNDLKDFFLFKIFFTIAMIFFFIKKFCAFLTIKIFALFSRLLLAKHLFFDVSSIIFRIFDELLFAFDETNYRLLIDWKKYVFFFFFARENVFAFDQDSFAEI